MGVTEKIFITTCCMVCLFYSADSARVNIVRLKRNVDFLLDNVLELRREFRSIQDAVNDIQQQRNFSEEEEANGVASDILNEPNSTDVGLISKSVFEDFDLKMLTLQEGFREEKFNIRQKLEHNFKSVIEIVTRRIDTVDGTMTGNISTLQYLLEGSVTNINSTLNEAVEFMSERINYTTKRIDHMEAVTKQKIKTLNDTIINIIRVINKGYAIHENSMYNVFSQETWTQAKLKCLQDNSHLAEINDWHEYIFLQSLVPIKSVWIGGTDFDNESNWVWSASGSPVDTWLWRSGEPNDHGGNEDCSQMHGASDGLNDADCSTIMDYICESEFELNEHH